MGAAFSHRLWNFSFSLLFLSQVLKNIAENFALVAFVWLLIQTGGGAISTSTLFFCSFVPQMLLSSIVSPLLSRGRIQNWMFGSDVLRAVIVMVVPVCYLLNILPIWVFFVSALLQSALGSVYTPASVALLPKIVEKSQVQTANAFMQSSSQIVTLLGLAGAGAVVTVLSAPATLIITSVLFLVSAGLIFCVKQGEDSNVGDTPDKKAASSYIERIKEGFVITRRHKLIYALAIYAIFLNIGSAPYMALYSP